MSAATYPVGTIAKLLMLTERRVQQLTAEGVIPKPERGRYELVGAVQGYIGYLKARTAGLDALEAGPDAAGDKVRLIKAKADLMSMEAARASRELLPAAEVAKADEVIFAGLRDRVMAVQSVAPLLCDAALKDGERAVRPILREALTSALEDIGSAEVAAVAA